MSVFSYIAYDKEGKKQKGFMESESTHRLRQLLRERGLVPVEISETARTSTQADEGWQFWKKKRISIADLALLTRELATLLASGMPLEESLQAVAEQTERHQIKAVIQVVRSRVLEGYTLASGLSHFPHIFPEIYCATVGAGEKSGHLSVVLNQLADYTEQQYDMRQQIQQALVYPVFMTIVSFSIVTFLLVHVVPKMTAIFEDTGATLPWLTQVLLSVSYGVQHYGFYVVLLLIAAAIAWRQALKKPAVRKSAHGIWLKIPMIGKTIKIINTARYARTLGILSASGVPLLEAMRIASGLINIMPMRESIEGAVAQVREGKGVSAALKQTGYFLPMTIHLIANGEASGALEEMLKRAADTQDQNVSRLLKGALTVFEPILILLMGAIVLFIVLAILLPMFEMTQLIA